VVFQWVLLFGFSLGAFLNYFIFLKQFHNKLLGGIIMSKLLQKFKSNEVQSIIQNTKFKVATATVSTLMAVQTVAHAETTAPDMATITASMTTSFATITNLCLTAVAAIAPIGITIFGCMFVWKKGIGFFKSVTKG